MTSATTVYMNGCDCRFEKDKIIEYLTLDNEMMLKV